MVGLIVLAVPVVARSAVITIVNADAPAEGLNDLTPTLPVGGNFGVTRGQQRFNALQHAANLWAAVIDSDVEILVETRFDLFHPDSCSASTAVLGFAAPVAAFSDFDGAPRPATLYASALADSLAGIDLNPGVADISATFNARLDLGCFTLGAPNGWYYGFDGLSGSSRIDIVQTALHELGHGLGFATFVNIATGARCCGGEPQDDAFMLRLEDHSTSLMWPDMSNAQRAASAVNTNQLHWVGPAVAALSPALSQGRIGTHVRMYAPQDLRLGSSVSHFDPTLNPDELMEPFLILSAGRSLAGAALKDIGWTLVGEPTPTATRSPSSTATAAPTFSPSVTPTPMPSLTATPSPTASPSPSSTFSHTPTATAASTATSSPTATASITRTQTVTPSPTETPTPTATRSPTASPSATASTTPTPSSTDTRSATPTRTATQTRTSTSTRTATVTRTVTVTRTATVTHTATLAPTVTATATTTSTTTASHTPTPTATPLLPCAADCDNDRRVAIPELQASASIFLSILGVSACPAADLDGSTRIDVTELQRAVVTFLVGCP